MIDGQNDTIVIGLQACAPVFATGSIDDAAEAGEEGSCCNGFQVDWLSEDVRRLLAAHGFTAPDPVDSVARRMVEREVLTPGYLQAGYSLIERDGRCGRTFPCEVEFVYGRDEVPAEVSRAVLELAAYTLRPSNRPVGATGESTDAGGYIHFIAAGRDGATAVPEVNAAIEMFGRGEACVW